MNGKKTSEDQELITEAKVDLTIGGCVVTQWEIQTFGEGVYIS